MRAWELGKKIWHLNRVAPVAILVLLAAVAAGWALNERLLQPKVRELERRMALRRQQLSGGEGRAGAGAPVSRERLSQGAADVEAFWNRIPRREAFPELLSELMNLAMQSGLALERVQYRPDEKAQEGLLRFALAFSVNGNYPQVKKFIHLLERSPRLLIIDQVSLSGKSNGGGVSLNVGVSTFFRE